MTPDRHCDDLAIRAKTADASLFSTEAYDIQNITSGESETACITEFSLRSWNNICATIAASATPRKTLLLKPDNIFGFGGWDDIQVFTELVNTRCQVRIVSRLNGSHFIVAIG